MLVAPSKVILCVKFDKTGRDPALTRISGTLSELSHFFPELELALELNRAKFPEAAEPSVHVIVGR